jgi:hypothetical protein
MGEKGRRRKEEEEAAVREPTLLLLWASSSGTVGCRPLTRVWFRGSGRPPGRSFVVLVAGVVEKWCGRVRSVRPSGAVWRAGVSFATLLPGGLHRGRARTSSRAAGKASGRLVLGQAQRHNYFSISSPCDKIRTGPLSTVDGSLGYENRDNGSTARSPRSGEPLVAAVVGDSTASTVW